MSESNGPDSQHRRDPESEAPDEAGPAADGSVEEASDRSGDGQEESSDPAAAAEAVRARTHDTPDEADPPTPAPASEQYTPASPTAEAGEDAAAADDEPDANTDTDQGTTTGAPAGPATGGRAVGAGGGGRRGRVIAAVVAVLVVLAAVGGAGGYLYWRIQQLEQRVAAVPDERERALERFARSEALAQSIDELEGKVSSEVERLEQAIQDVSASDSESAQALGERLEDLKQAVATARELAGRDQLDWRLAEVHYLVGVAARRLAIAHDRRAAIAAMEAADRSLAQVGDVRLLELRQRLVDDITALRQTEPADVEGIALRIQSLLQRIPDLPPRQQRERTAGGEDGAGASTAAGDWWQRLREGLSNYVVVRRQGDAEGPARPRADRSLPAAEKLGYALSEARRAALRREPDPYAQAIERARALIDEHFASESPAVGYFREALADLAERGVTTSYPDLTRTLDRVEKVTAELKARRERPDRVGSEGED